MAGNNSRFLPGSITSALKSLIARVFGALVMLLGVWATVALVFYILICLGWRWPVILAPSLLWGILLD